jgi:hypothetical protein
VNEEVIDLFYKVIDATIIVVLHPREKVVDGSFRECSRFTRSDDAFERTVPKALESGSRRTRL